MYFCLAVVLISTALAAAVPTCLTDSDACTAIAQGLQWKELNFHVINSTWMTAQALNISSTLNAIPFCRVYGTMSYAGNETLGVELWLPSRSDYTGRYASIGNGGFAGTVDESGLLTRLNEGFAVAGSDAGHLASANTGNYLPFFHDRAETLAWLREAVALFTPTTRQLTAQYYCDAPSYSYYFGCSTGGAQGFALAQHYPDLFDGLYAGSPGFWYSHLMLSFLWNALHTEGASAISQETLNAITAAVLAQCDAIDGVDDGVLENPLRCPFDITTLACASSSANQTDCLTSTQLSAAKAIYAGPKDVRTGKEVYPGFVVGSESSWFQQEGFLATTYAVPLLQNLVFDNEAYNASTFNWGSDIDTVDEKAGPLIDDINANLTLFKESGSKMIITQGWADQYNAPTLPIEYLEEVESVLGADASDFLKLFMVPGGGHCGSNPIFPHVPGTYQVAGALVDWVEKGDSPTYVLSTDPPDDSNGTRRLCPWPQTARFNGGDQNSHLSYSCS